MENPRSLRTSLLLVLVLLLLSAIHSCSAKSMSCLSCVFYAHISMPINNPLCATSRGIGSKPCGAGQACKVTFLQDSSDHIVHAARSCHRFSSGRPSLPATVVFNARTTMYCDSSGCNNNWLGRPGQWQPQRLHCWVGHGRSIDQFQLQRCSDKVLELAAASANLSGTARGQQTGARPVCLLAQLTRQIEHNGSTFESSLYIADCVPHASSVYGNNYPMFEYERVCRDAGCNSDRAADRLQAGLMTGAAAGNSSATSQACRLAVLLQPAVAAAVALWATGLP